jgi:exodeoxyribonuclease VII small subunit
MPESTPQDAADATFEAALERLEKIVAQLEDGRTDLAASLAGYEEGVKLLRKCHALLERAERRIEILSGVDAEGRPVVQAFDDTSTISLEEKAQTRSKRRSTKKSASDDPETPGSDPTNAPSAAPSANRAGMDGPATLF